MEIKKSIAQGVGKGELYDVLTELQTLAQYVPCSGETYYVSPNGNNTTGLSWKNAFTTISAAVTASDAYIDALGTTYVGKNRIYIDGGQYAALTALPKKCDMIGCGGNLVRVAGSSVIATAALFCHIYNMWFTTITAASIVELPAECAGIEFHNCVFRNDHATGTYGLKIGANSQIFKVDNCQFIGNGHSSITGIYFGDGCEWSEITNNTICALTSGITIAAGQGNYQTVIKNNIIGDFDIFATQLATGITIEEAQGRCLVVIVANWISAAVPISNVATYPNMIINNHAVVAGNGYLVTEETP